MATQQPLVVVTGSAGYLGSTLVERLLSDYRVVGLDRKRHEPQPPAADFVQCDLTNADSVELALQTI